MNMIAKIFGLAALSLVVLAGAFGAAQAAPSSYSGQGCDNPIFQGD